MEFDNNLPIYIQVIQDIKRDIMRGNLSLGEKLPSGRDLALKYKINPNTSSRIYKELEMLELCYTKRGLGTYVTKEESKVKEIREEMAENLLQVFIDGMKDLGFIKEEITKLIEEKY